jgi:hypothetical protein
MRYLTFVLSLALVFVAGCKEPQTHSVWSSVDSWYHPPSDWTPFRQAQGLSGSDIIEVSSGHMQAAEEQLSELACAQITPERASDLTGHSITSRAGSSLFLVRAVFFNRGGKFMVKPVGNELLVEHGSLGHSSVPMKRQALVVRLSQKPERVFVSCSIAE